LSTRQFLYSDLSIAIRWAIAIR